MEIILRVALCLFGALFIILSLQSLHQSFSLPQVISAVSSNIHSTPADEPLWLAWVTTAAHLRQRREIMRSTWIHLYRDVPFTARFVMGTPAAEWLPAIQQENETYGDIIMLEGQPDDHNFATHNKPFELMKYLTAHRPFPERQWDFVSKIDDDSFIDAKTFWDEFLLPNRHANRTMISRVVQYGWPFQYPGGQFCTMTWDLIPLLAELYERDHQDDVDDDVKMAKYLVENDEPFHFIELSLERAFDYPSQGDMNPQAINPHKLDSDIDYLRIASYYDENGYRGRPRGELAGESMDEDTKAQQDEMIRNRFKGVPPSIAAQEEARRQAASGGATKENTEIKRDPAP